MCEVLWEVNEAVNEMIFEFAGDFVQVLWTGSEQIAFEYWLAIWYSGNKISYFVAARDHHIDCAVCLSFDLDFGGLD